MQPKRRRMTVLLFIICLIVGLCGCSMSDTELLKLPKPPSAYLALQKQLDPILNNGATYAAPISGTNRNQIQFVDLDNDGKNEVVSFFRNSTEVGSALHVYIYKEKNNSYEGVAQIGGPGDTFDSVWYPRLDATGKTAIVLGTKLGTTPTCGVQIFLYEDERLQTIYSGGYTGIIVADLNGNDTDEILLLRHSASTDAGTATLLSYESGELKEISTAPLSAGIANPLRIRLTDIGYGENTVTVEANAFDKAYTTDILMLKNGVLTNLLYSDSAKTSILTYRYLPIFSCDINKDGITELPRPEVLPGYDAQAKNIQWSIDWCTYDPNIFLNRIETTYLNIAERWYFSIPDALVGNYTVERGFHSDTVRSTIFYAWNRAEGQRSDLLWEIFKLTGDDRAMICEEQKLWEIARTHDAIYAFRYGDNLTATSYSVAEISDLFHLIENEWVYDNWAIAEE